jgi:hypothetical protein
MKLRHLIESDQTATPPGQKPGIFEQLIEVLADTTKAPTANSIRHISRIANDHLRIKISIKLKAIRVKCMEIASRRDTADYDDEVDIEVDDAIAKFQEIKAMYSDETHQFFYGSKTPGYINMMLKKVVEKLAATSTDEACKIYSKAGVDVFEVPSSGGSVHYFSAAPLIAALNLKTHAPEMFNLVDMYSQAAPSNPPRRLVFFRVANQFLMVSVLDQYATSYWLRTEENWHGAYITSSLQAARKTEEEGVIPVKMGAIFAEHTDAIVNAFDSVFSDDRYFPALEFVK